MICYLNSKTYYANVVTSPKLLGVSLGNQFLSQISLKIKPGVKHLIKIENNSTCKILISLYSVISPQCILS